MKRTQSSDAPSILLVIHVLVGLLSPHATAQATPAETAAAFLGPQDLPEFARAAWAATVFIETRSWTSTDRDVSYGSGVVIAREPGQDENGDGEGSLLIVTSHHVVPCEAACLIRVALPTDQGEPNQDGTVTVRARRVQHDPLRDLAVLRAPWPKDVTVTVAPLADAATTRGDEVVAIGFPDPELRDDEPLPGRVKLFSRGRLSIAQNSFEADYRAYASTAVDGHLSLDTAWIHTAALLPGSSGGPLINADGAVVGINSGSLVPTDGQGCVRDQGTKGGSCLHLAIALDTVLEMIPSRAVASSSGASTGSQSVKSKRCAAVQLK